LADQNNNKELGSWKEIASFLGISERTAQNWELERGLPVKRLAGPRGRVSISSAELERWKEQNFNKPSWYSNVNVLRYYAVITSTLIIHLDDFPNQFAILDDKGKTLKEYWHSGHLPVLEVNDVNGDGFEEILLGGVNNGYGCATLVVLDPRNVSGASTQTADDHRQLMGFGQAKEKLIIQFPKTVFNRGLFKYNATRNMSITKDAISVYVAESEGDMAATVTYRFTPELTLQDVEISDHLENLYQASFRNKVRERPYSPSEKEDLKNNIRIFPAAGRVRTP
jgi:hypothetical protein